MIVVVVIEPRREGEPPLSVSGQINQIFGPFADEAAADAWISSFQEHALDFEHFITSVDEPVLPR